MHRFKLIHPFLTLSFVSIPVCEALSNSIDTGADADVETEDVDAIRTGDIADIRHLSKSLKK